MTTPITYPSKSCVEEEVKAIKRAADKINESREKARAFLREHGFITKDDQLTKRYR